MDLTSLTPRGDEPPTDFNDLTLETRVLLDEHGRPYYVAVPVPAPLVPTGPPVSYVPATVPEPVVYQPAPSTPPTYSALHDPVVARLLAGTVAVVGSAFALSFVLAALAAATAALGLLLGILALIWLLSMTARSGSGKSSVTVNITNANKSKHRG